MIKQTGHMKESIQEIAEERENMKKTKADKGQ
jgi:hypothetical protein